MKHLIIILACIFVLVNCAYAEIDWKKGVQVDVMPEWKFIEIDNM